MSADIWTVAWKGPLPSWIDAALRKSLGEPGAATWDPVGEGLWVNTATAGGVMVPMGDCIVRDERGGLHAVTVPSGWELVPVPAQVAPEHADELNRLSDEAVRLHHQTQEDARRYRWLRTHAESMVCHDWTDGSDGGHRIELKVPLPEPSPNAHEEPAEFSSALDDAIDVAMQPLAQHPGPITMAEPEAQPAYVAAAALHKAADSATSWLSSNCPADAVPRVHIAALATWARESVPALPSREVDEAGLARLRANGAKAWADVSDPGAWVESIRGNVAPADSEGGEPA